MTAQTAVGATSPSVVPVAGMGAVAVRWGPFSVSVPTRILWWLAHIRASKTTLKNRKELFLVVSKGAMQYSTWKGTHNPMISNAWTVCFRLQWLDRT